MQVFSRLNVLILCIFLISLFSLHAHWQEELRTKIKNHNFPSWMLDQIHEDLEPFKAAGVSLRDIKNTINEHPTYGFVICTINNNSFSWYCHPDESKNDFRAKMFVGALEALKEAVTLPNVVFLVFVGESFADTTNQAPVFCWCKHRELSKKSICFPDYEALNGNYHFLNEAFQGNQRFPWEAKECKAFWRGASTGGWGFEFMPRLKLVELSANVPHLIDAKITNTFIGQDERIFQPFIGRSASIVDHLRYKYQILVDGHVSAFSRAYWQLFSNSVIFKHDSPWYQWFYRALRPYEHYIPYHPDATDLVEKIKWAMEHDDLAHSISQNANHFAHNNLKHSDIMLYVYLLLNEYAKIQKF